MKKFIIGMVIGSAVTGYIVYEVMSEKMIEQDSKNYVEGIKERSKSFNKGYDNGAQDILHIAKRFMQDKTVQDLIDYYKGTKWEV